MLHIISSFVLPILGRWSVVIVIHIGQLTGHQKQPALDF